MISEGKGVTDDAEGPRPKPPRAPVELPANNAITYWNPSSKSTSLNSCPSMWLTGGRRRRGGGVRRRYVVRTELFYGTCSIYFAGLSQV